MFCIVSTPETERLREQYNKKYNDNMTEQQFIALLEAMMSRYRTGNIPSDIAAINRYYQQEREKDKQMEQALSQPRYYEKGFKPVSAQTQQNTSLYAEEQNREMEEIKQRAIANGTFMKAPNGNHTKLNERQWLQVRTEAFKKWFGDWIGNPFANNVSLGAGTFNADNADMSGYRPEFPFFVNGEFAGSFHFENLIINKDGEGITDDKYLTFPEVGWALELEPEFRGKGYGKAMYYEAAKVAAKKGRSLRSASLSNMSEDAKHVWESFVKNGYAKLEDNHYVFNNEKLNYSKVVDENGEPLVVHHYTDNETLSEFSIDFDNYFSQTGGTKKAIFFTEDNVEPGSEDNFLTNREKKLDVFLNIRDIETHYGTKEDLHKQGTSYREVVNKSSEKQGKANGLHFSGFDDNQKTDQDIWVVHDPNQVKSATDNIGTFSIKDNNIFYSLAPEEGPVKWARTSGNNYEVSTRGDKRFSALNARFEPGTKILGQQVDGMTIEDVYQRVLKQSRKGQSPKVGSFVNVSSWLSYYESGNPVPEILSRRLPEQLLNKLRDAAFGGYTFTKDDYEDFSYYMGYLPLWKLWAQQHPELMGELRIASQGKTLTDQFANTRVSQARALAHILNEESAINQNESSSNEVKQVASTIAPYRRTTYADYVHMSPEERSRMRDAFAAAAKNIASLLGIELDMSIASANIGGYQFEDGGDIVEPSFTFRMNTTPEKARMFSALMADLGWEQQEAVATFMSVDNPEDGNGVRFTIKFSERLLSLLEKHGIKNFIFDKQNEVLSVLSFDEADVQRLYNLTEELNNGQPEDRQQEVGTAPFFSTLDFEEDRRALYEEWLRREGGQNPVLDNLVKAALQKVTPQQQQQQPVTANNNQQQQSVNTTEQAPQSVRKVDEELLKIMKAQASELSKEETNEMLSIVQELMDTHTQEEVQTRIEYLASRLMMAMDMRVKRFRNQLKDEIKDPKNTADDIARIKAHLINLYSDSMCYAEAFKLGMTPIDIIEDVLKALDTITRGQLDGGVGINEAADMIDYFDPLMRSAFLVVKRRTGIEFTVDNEALGDQDITTAVADKIERDNAAPSQEQLQQLVSMFNTTSVNGVDMEQQGSVDPDNPDDANGESEAAFFDARKENPYKSLSGAVRKLFSRIYSGEINSFGKNKFFDPEFIYACVMDLMSREVNKPDDFCIVKQIVREDYPEGAAGDAAYQHDLLFFPKGKPTFPAFEKYRSQYSWMGQLIHRLTQDYNYNKPKQSLDMLLNSIGEDPLEVEYGRTINLLYNNMCDFVPFYRLNEDGSLTTLNEQTSEESIEKSVVHNYQSRTVLSSTMVYDSRGKVNVENVEKLLQNIGTGSMPFSSEEDNAAYLNILVQVNKEFMTEFDELMADMKHIEFLDSDAKAKLLEREKQFNEKRWERFKELFFDHFTDYDNSESGVFSLKEDFDGLVTLTNTLRSLGFDIKEEDVYRGTSSGKRSKIVEYGPAIIKNILKHISTQKFLESGVDNIYAGTDDKLWGYWRNLYEQLEGVVYASQHATSTSEKGKQRSSYMRRSEMTRMWKELTHMDVQRRRQYMMDKWGDNPFFRDQSVEIFKNADGLWESKPAGWRNKLLELQWQNNADTRMLPEYQADIIANGDHEFEDWTATDITEMQLALFLKGMKAQRGKFNNALYMLPIFADSPVCKALGGRRYEIHGDDGIIAGMTEVAMQEYDRIHSVGREMALNRYAKAYFKAQRAGKTLDFADLPASQQAMATQYNPDAEGIIPQQRDERLATLRKAANHNEIANLFKRGLSFQFIPELNNHVTVINGQRIKVLDYARGRHTRDEVTRVLRQAVDEVLQRKYEDFYAQHHNIYDRKVQENINKRAIITGYRVVAADGSRPYFRTDENGNPMVFVNEGEPYWSRGRMRISRGEWFYLNDREKDLVRNLDNNNVSQKDIDAALDFRVPLKKGKFGNVVAMYGQDDNIDYWLRQMWYNSTYDNSQKIQVMFGDVAFAKNFDDFQKRWKALYASGMPLNTNSRYGRQEYNVVLLKDNKRSISSSYSNIYKAFDKAVAEGRITKQQRDKWVSAYHKIDATDAQGLRSLDSFRRVLDMAGKWSGEMEQSYNRLKNGKWTEQDLNFLIQTIKPVYMGTHKHELPGGMKVQVPTYIKNSEAVLLTVLTAVQMPYSPTMKALDRFQQSVVYKEGKNAGQTVIDAYQYETAVKLGGQGAVDLRYSRKRLQQLRTEEGWRAAGLGDAYRSFSSLLKDDTTLAIMSYDDIDDWAHKLIEAAKNADSVGNALRLANDVLNFLDYSRDQDKDKQQEWEDEMVDILTGAVYTDPNSDEINPEVVHQLDYNNMVIQQPTPHHAVDGTVSFGSQLRYLLPIDLPDDMVVTIHGKKYNKSQLIEHYNRLMVARALKGYEEANSVFKDIHTLQKYLLSIVKDNPRYGDDMVNALEIVTWTDEQGNKHETFALPNTSVNMSNKLEELLTAVYRNKVHKQKMHGGSTIIMADMKYSDELKVRFDKSGHLEGVECLLPAAAKGIIKACGKYNKETGEYTISPKKWKEAGLDKIVGYRIPTEDKHSMLPLIVKDFLPPAMGSAIVVSKEIIIMTGGDNDVDKLYLFTHHYNVKKGQLEKVVYDATQSENENSKAQIENEIIDVAYAILTSDKVTDKLFKPQDYETVRETAMIIQVINDQAANAYARKLFADRYGTAKEIDFLNLDKDILEDAYELTNHDHSPIYPETYSYYHNQNSSGKAEVGIFANNSALNAKLQDKHIMVKPKYIMTVNGREINELSPMYITVGNQRIRVSDNCSELLGAAADTAKDPLLARMGITKANAPFAGFLVRMGLTLQETGLFLSIFSKHGVPKDFRKWVRKAIKDGDVEIEPVTTKMLVEVLTTSPYELDYTNPNQKAAVNVFYALMNFRDMHAQLREVVVGMQADSPNHALETDFASGIYYKYAIDRANTLIRDADFPFDFPRDEHGKYKDILPVNGDDSFEAIMQSGAPVTQAYHTLGISKAIDKIGQRSILGDPAFHSWMKRLEPYLFSMKKDEAIRVIRALYREYITFYLSRLPIFNGVSGNREGFIENRQYFRYDFPYEYIKFVNDPKYGVQNNVALSRIIVDDDGRLIINNEQLSDMVKPYIFAGLDSLWQNADQGVTDDRRVNFARALFMYSYFSNGLVFSFNDVSNFFSVNFLSRDGHFDDFIKALADLESKAMKAHQNGNNESIIPFEESERYFRQFVRNNGSRFKIGDNLKEYYSGEEQLKAIEDRVNENLKAGRGPIYELRQDEATMFHENMFYRLPVDNWHSSIFQARTLDSGEMVLFKIADGTENDKWYYYGLDVNDMNKKEAWYYPGETAETWKRPVTTRQLRKQEREARKANAPSYLAEWLGMPSPDTNDTTSSANVSDDMPNADDNVDQMGIDFDRAEEDGGIDAATSRSIESGAADFDMEATARDLEQRGIFNRLDDQEAERNRETSIDGIIPSDALSQAESKLDNPNPC